jgi:hypothetical protein
MPGEEGEHPIEMAGSQSEHLRDAAGQPILGHRGTDFDDGQA